VGAAAAVGECSSWTPLLGAARPSSSKKLGYAVSGAGRLLVFDSVLGTKEWEGPFDYAYGKVTGNPTLDCDRTNRATGTLYVPQTNGTLTAIIVDSPGLDLTAAWPKYQRTVGNAGNHDPRFPIGTSGCP
jgi:outer membrane protein assembly factor BamB